MTILLLALASALLVYGIWELSPNTLASAVRNAIALPRAGADRAPLPRVHDLPSHESSLTDQQSRSAVLPWARSRILTLWLPLAIVGVGFALRTIDLSVDPHGFFCDEASNGLDAYLIGHTLHNRQHVFLPVFFQALDDWRGGFHIYWDVPFMMVFGLTVFATRLGSAVAGTLTVWLTYLFVGKAVNRPVGLLSALLLATSPWHLLTSRMGFEFVSLPFDVALCLTFLYYGLERPRLLPLAFVFGGLGMYTYQPARIFVPLLCLAWIVLYNQEVRRHRRYSIIGIVAGAIILIPVPIAIHDGTFTARLSQLQGPSQSLSDRLSTTWANYLAHFQPSFLFDTSTDWITRHYVHGFGMLYGVEAPFLVLGVIMMVVRHRHSDLLFLWWFLIYPIATAIVSPPISTRSIDGVIVFQIAVAIGIVTVAEVFIRVVAHLRSVRFASLAVGLPVVVLVLAGVTVTTGQFMTAYFNEYPKYSSGWSGWQSGAGDIASYFMQNHRQYSSLLENAEFNAPDVLLAFYTTPHPNECAACGIVNLNDRNVMQVYYQRNRPELWAVSPDAFIHSPLVSVKHRIVHRLRYPDGTVSFLFVATGPGA